MIIEIEPYEAIVAAGATKTYYEKIVKHYQEAGCPDLMRDVTREHLDGVISSHRTLIFHLRKEGYLMKGNDIEPVDHKALVEKEYVPLK